MRVVALTPADDSFLPAAPAWRLDVVTTLCFAMVCMCASNLARIPIAQTAQMKAPIILNDVLAGATVVVAVLVALRLRTLIVDDVTLAALSFALVGGLSALAAMPRFDLSPIEVTLGLAYLARWLLYMALYVVVINFVRGRDTDRVWRAVELAVLLYAGFGIFQSAFLPNFAQRLFPDSRNWVDHDVQGHRLISTILDPNLSAALILTVLLVHIAQLSAGAKVKLWKPAVLFIALLLTFSRSGAVAFFVGCGVIVAAQGANLSKRVVRFAGIGVLVIAALSPVLIAFGQKYVRFSISDPSAMARVVNLGRALGTFLESPWFGIGFNTYGFVQERRGVPSFNISSYTTEGGLLFIAVLTGVVGVSLYCLMLWRVIRRCRRTWRLSAASADQRGFAMGVAAVTIAMVADAVFVNSLLTPAVMEPMVVLWGLSFVVAADAHARTTGAT